MKRALVVLSIIFSITLVVVSGMILFYVTDTGLVSFVFLRDQRDHASVSDVNDRENSSLDESEPNAGSVAAAEADVAIDQNIEIAPEIGAQAPDFTLTTITGETVRLADFRGQVVMLNFWAVWCPPCIEELPAIQRIYDTYGDQVVLLMVNSGDARVDVEAFMNVNHYTFNCLLDLEDKVSDQFRVRNIPTTFFIDPSGIIQSIRIGSMDEEKILDYLVDAGFNQ